MYEALLTFCYAWIVEVFAIRDVRDYHTRGRRARWLPDYMPTDRRASLILPLAIPKAAVFVQIAERSPTLVS
jgi:hypothetical protein